MTVNAIRTDNNFTRHCRTSGNMIASDMHRPILLLIISLLLPLPALAQDALLDILEAAHETVNEAIKEATDDPARYQGQHVVYRSGCADPHSGSDYRARAKSSAYVCDEDPPEPTGRRRRIGGGGQSGRTDGTARPDRRRER